MAEKPLGLTLKKRFFKLRTLITFALAVAFLVFILFRLDVDLGATWGRIKGARPLFYVLAFLAYYATFPLRGWRWHRMLRSTGLTPPSPRQLTPLVFLSFFANCVFYARLGDAYRAYLLKEDGRASFSLSLGTIVAERAMDAILVFLLLAVAGFGLWGGRIPGPILILGLGIVLAMVLALIGIKGLGGMLGRRLPSPLKPLFSSFQDGALGSLRPWPLLALLGLAIWLLEAARLFFVVQALGLSLNPLLVLFAAQAVALLSALPLTPGGLGLVEPGVAGLLMLALPKEEAWAVALLDRSVNYLSIIVFGGVLFLWREMRRKG